MITFVTSWWHGWRPIYEAEHVYRLAGLLDEYVSIPYRFVCMTNLALRDVETIPLQEIPWKKQHRNIPNCFPRMWLFSREAAELGDYIVNVDLDVDIFRDISELFTGDEEFKILTGQAAPYNGSLWKLKAGALPHIWEELNEVTAKQANRQIMAHNGRRYYGSDQAWMSYRLPNRPTWGTWDGIYQHVSLINGIPEGARMVFYAGNVKPWDLEKRRNGSGKG